MSYELERPEAFLGHMIALEGVRDAMTIIHGPTGCKMYPSDLTERLFIRRKDEIEMRDAFRRDMKYFFYQPRLPCTLLDGNRLIMGSSERLADLYSIVVNSKPSLIGVINSPGASLTGENLDNVDSDIPTIRIPSHDFSAPMYEGFSETAVRIIDTIAKKSDVKKGTVNIFGFSIWHIKFEDDVEELRRMLSLCGIEVNCFLSAGSSVEEITRIPSAELNIVVDRDFGLRAAEHCKERFGTPFIDIMPIGFDSCETMIREVCKILGKDPSAALADSRYWRKKTAMRIQALEKRYVKIRGRTFSVHGTPALTENLSLFLFHYLGIVPVALQCGKGPEWFGDLGLPVSEDIWNEYCDITYGSGNEIAAMMDRGMTSGGVEIYDPTVVPVNVFSRPMFGTLGSVRIMEDTLNIIARVTDRL
ncbi:MAG: nitrogenase component 1 [Candidatus Methanomethylophilaceae archaeon]|nr:nitrogenase component 1 [Candidatus Methanomethylophilaceae archaeon]